MLEFELMKGYSPDFLGPGLEVNLPKIPAEMIGDIAPLKDGEGYVLDYHNYSVVQNAARKLPVFTISNIDGKKIKSISRSGLFPGGSDRWVKDKRIAYDQQWGSELYSAKGSDFDKGHMVKREDVQWGDNDPEAALAAQSTFFYTNSVPQHAKVNRAIWLKLEDFILHEETVGEELKVNVITGPVLRPDDPLFIGEVKGEEVPIPTLFWKVVYFTKFGTQLCRVAFLMGQEGLLEKDGVIHPRATGRGLETADTLFLNFEEADTYQVNVDFVESLTGLKFPEAVDPFMDDRPSKLTLQEVEVRGLEGGTQVFLEGLTI